MKRGQRAKTQKLVLQSYSLFLANQKKSTSPFLLVVQTNSFAMTTIPNPYALLLERLEEIARRVGRIEELVGGKLEDTSKHLLSKREAAKLLNVSSSFIDTAARNGWLERRYITPSSVRFLRQDVEALPEKIRSRNC